jgi:predicted phosphatase
MTYLFDLDITLWDTFDKRGNSIWAKQLVAPYRVQGNMIVDDVFSKCVLRKGVREYLKHLREENHQVGFVSVGGYFGMEYSRQPSIRALELFGILKYFNSIHVLEYKTYNKAHSISTIKDKVVFYDDAPKNFEAVKNLTNVTCVDSLNIKDWSQLIGKKYD